jgi:hypothetical protein
MRQDADSPQRDSTQGGGPKQPSGEPGESGDADELIAADSAAEPTAPSQGAAAGPREVGSESFIGQQEHTGETTTEESSVRLGSPFAEDPFETDDAPPIENLYDVGPLKYTALGAVAASVLVLGFAAAAAYLFPAGGTMVAALGCLLSLFGMYSPWRLASAGLLAVHLFLFLLSYGRTMT